MNKIQAVLFIFMVAKIVEVGGFQPEPFRALVIVDENVERTEFVNSVVQNFPDGSSFDRQISFGGAVSSAFLDDTIFEEFNANQFKKEAEIVLVFVNTSTKLDGEPKFSGKKKTFVVVCGSSVPETWKNLATDANHLFLVTRDSNSSRIIEHLIKQINFDSKYYCDIDMYRMKKGQKCRNCSNVCGADPKQRSMSCSHYCPYFWSKEEKLTRSSSSTPIPVTIYPEKDHKHTVVTGVIIAVIIIIVVIIGVIVIYCIKKKKQLTPSNSDRDVRPVPLSTAHQETEGQGSEGSSLINSGQEVELHLLVEGENMSSSEGDDGADPCMTNPENMPDERECRVNLNEAGLSSEGDGGADPCMTNPENMPVPIFLKNKQEADLNAHYSDENVRNIH